MSRTTHCDGHIDAAVPMAHDPRWSIGRSVPIAPIQQPNDNGEEVPSGGSRNVFVACAFSRLPIRTLLDHACRSQLGQPTRQNGLRDAEVSAHFFKPLHSVEHLPQDEKSPFLTDDVQGRLHRAVLRADL
jgi:hypothetical protein